MAVKVLRFMRFALSWMVRLLSRSEARAQSRLLCRRDGKIVVFASTEDLVGTNADRNSEIFMFDGSGLKQLTETEPDSKALRMSDGNFQPSVTA